MNKLLPGEGDGFAEDGDELDALALDWALPGAERDPEGGSSCECKPAANEASDDYL